MNITFLFRIHFHLLNPTELQNDRVACLYCSIAQDYILSLVLLLALDYFFAVYNFSESVF
jgi:hypothetical protein